MAFIDAVKYNKVKSMKGLPIGAIIPWSADQSLIPTGWVICNGATISITKYPLLFDVIENTYGGTAGSTFRVPQLTNSPKAIIDIFRGHHEYLKTRGNAYAPDYSSISSDPYWSLIGQGNNADEIGNTQVQWQSTIDLVGVITSSPNFFASYQPISLTQGEYQGTINYNDTTLRDFHLQAHSHGIGNTSTTESEGYTRKSSTAVECPGGWGNGACRINCSTTQVYRVREGLLYANRSDNLNTAFATWSGPAAGGGEIRRVPGGQTASGGYYPGNGRCVNDMTCASFSGNDRILFTSLSNEETSIANVAAHGHDTNTYNFRGNLNVVNPGLRTNISLNDVAINNSAGLNYGTISVTTSTASLEMLFIIRAY
jgi:hypothetical protein